MDSIRVRRGIEIEVNDLGETIRIDSEDVNFINRYKELVDNIGKISDSIDENAELSEDETILLISDKMTDACNEIDKLFGERASAKVFGDGVIPTPFAIMDFFEQLTPFMERINNERQKMLDSKSVRRTGGKRV